MYKAYSIHMESRIYPTRSISKQQKKTVIIDDFLNSHGNVVAKDLIELWFPQKNFNIFLSHSHRDEDLALDLSEYLNNNFGLTTFIDSQVWDYADDLLAIFDNKFCRENPEQNYNYKLRNITTAHIHNMLSVALTEMMDECECIFFLNTKNSIVSSIPSLNGNKKTIKENIYNVEKTYSSWIYMELKNLIKLRKRKVVRDFGMESYTDSVNEQVLASSKRLSSNIEYDIHDEIKYLPKIDEKILNEWERKFKPLKEIGVPEFSLDMLYEIVPMHFPS